MPCDTCENKVVEANGKCASCNFEERKAERMAKKAKKVYRIPKVSAKRKEELKEYDAEFAQWLKDNPKCKVRLIGCTDNTTDRHHSSGRGKNLNNKETWIPICRACHRKLHDVLSAKDRREKGLLI